MSSHRFLSSAEGLLPSTIYDRDADMDISEEMEEIRELLYELIKKNFPMGVSSAHLAEKYNEEYASKGLGSALPVDWLDQVAAAEEFEAQTRGPLTILFVRLQNTSSFKRPPVPLTNVRIISSAAETSKIAMDDETAKKRKDQYPLDHAKMLRKASEAIRPKSEVMVVAYESSEELYLRSLEDEPLFEALKKKLKQFYVINPKDTKLQIYEILVGGAYALCDAAGDWFRVIAEDAPKSGTGLVTCFFVDVGVRGSFPFSDLRLLPDPGNTIVQDPALALRVGLEMPVTGPQSETDSVLRQLLFETDVMGNLLPIKLQVTSLKPKKSSSGSAFVDLWTRDGRAIKEEALSKLADGKENRSIEPLSVNTLISTPIFRPTQIAPSAPSTAVTTSFCLFDEDAEIVPLDSTQMPTTTFHANALFAAGPTDISMRQVSLDPMPDYMYAKLQEECELRSAVLDSTPVPGKYYAAVIDDRWERVQCVRASKIDKASFCVYLVDVGAFHYVRGDSMRKLNAKTPFRKMLLFKCKVADIIPMGGQDVWSRESHEAVREFIEASMGEPLQVTPLPGAWSQWKQLNAPAVPVVEANVTCCGRSLSDWLIATGHAMPLIKPRH